MSVPAGIREISPPESLKPFIQLPWRINAGDPQWVPPLRSVQRTLFDRAKHPFHQHAEVAYFLAERAGAAVGRICAIVNRLHNDFHDQRTGFWGFFECEDDPATAAALLQAAERWLRERGMARMRGPTNFSTNEEGASPGILLEGFDFRPLILMSHNPPYYGRLVEAAGHEKAADLLAYRFTDRSPPPRVVRGVERILKRSDVKIRGVKLKHFEREIAIIKDVYNSAWQRNWGFVPMTDAEFEHMARDLRPIVDPDLALIAEAGGEPVGFCLALPDFNHALAEVPDGRLFPFGFLRLLWAKRGIHGMRVITLGLKPGHQHQGLGAALYLRAWQTGAEKGFDYAEASWILEDNVEMRRPLETAGASLYKRYRIYEKAL